MDNAQDLRPLLRQKATRVLGALSGAEREGLLIRCWMSHDARWFNAVSQECGMAVANRLNKQAAREIGRVEAQRIARVLRLPPVRTLDDYLLVQEILIDLLGPDLLHYRLIKVSDTAYRMEVRHCFAYEHALRAGVASEYECGIFARVTGWMEALGISCEINPPLAFCLKAQNQACINTFRCPSVGKVVVPGEPP